MKNDIEIPKELQVIGQKIINNEELDKTETLILLFASYSFIYNFLKNFRGEEDYE